MQIFGEIDSVPDLSVVSYGKSTAFVKHNYRISA
jgi:hypothetical protein